jgi:peptide deformylase
VTHDAVSLRDCGETFTLIRIALILPDNLLRSKLLKNDFMALLPILRYPDLRLFTKAKPVASVDDRIHQLAADMAETMYAAPGIGLAATQVDQHVRLLVIDISEDRSQLLTLINPEILEKSGTCEGDEGCLSVPGIYEPVTRAEHVKVRALGLDGQSFELVANELLAVCIQHEMDHLEGKVFVQYLSLLKQSRIKSKLAKQARAM